MTDSSIDEHNSPPKRRFAFSRWFRFRLRTLLLVTTIFGVAVGPELYYQFRQRDAAKQLRSLPATFLAYDYDLVPYEDWADHLPPFRTKVAGLVRRGTGSDLFNSVIRLFLNDASETSIGLIAKLRHLKWLQISGSTGSLRERPITSLKPLANCRQLEYLVIGNWLRLTQYGSEGFRGTGKTLLPYDISDSDLQTIGKLKKLRVLAIGGPFVTDTSLQHLSELNSLQYLYLSQTNVSPTGVVQLQRELPNAKIIELTDPDVDYVEEIASRF